jgi:nucleotide-binding universal stress UspA family protein
MRILVAVDGSKHGADALLSACRLLNPSDPLFDLLFVVAETRGQSQAHRARMRRRADRTLLAAEQAFAAQGIQAGTLTKIGSPAKVLLDASARYDLVAVAAQSRRGEDSAGLGPVASRLAEHAQCPVLLARAGAAESGAKILVAVDGSAGSLHALDRLAAFVPLEDAEVTLMHVVESPWLRGEDRDWLDQDDETGEPLDAQAQIEHELEREGHAIIEQARDRLPARTAVVPLIAEGLPADEILSEAERGGYDLAVIASSGSRDLKHQILGSVSSKVAWNAPCSVLLIPPTD